jgi:NAD(P)-dependent dehydrogenase (short-subunit alcohol dehydrogenase family)
MDPVCAVVGAGPGVGAAVARRFAAEGFALALLARRAEAVEALAGELAAGGGRAIGIAADAADAASLRAGLEAAKAQFGPIMVLVYNAVVARPAVPSVLDPDALIDEFRINVAGALVAAQSVLPGMRAAGRGSILLTGGGFAFEPMPMLASLGIGKAALRNLALSLHAELAPEGIHAATVTIGGVVQPGTAFDPAAIAEQFWRLHAQPRGAFEREILFRPGA